MEPGNFARTEAIIGDFQTPPELEGHPPDMTLLEEARRLMGYSTNGAPLYWWTRFPSPTWWRYANAATKFLCVPGKRGTRSTKPNYVYFLKTLKSAATQDKHFQKWAPFLREMLKVDIARGYSESAIADQRPICACSGGCEKCDPVLMGVRDELKRRGASRLPCFDCDGAVCARCVGGYLQVFAKAAEVA